jgi:DNA invertase Pin-like site-specific DNA recombinase
VIASSLRVKLSGWDKSPTTRSIRFRGRACRTDHNTPAIMDELSGIPESAVGRMMMQIVGAFAEFEQAMLRERTKAGLETARRDGRIGGRLPKLTPQQQAEIARMVSRGSKTAADAARLSGVHPATVSRLLYAARAGR